MNEIEKKNRQAIQVGFPELYDRLSSLSEQEASGDVIALIESMETLSELPAFVVQTKEGRIERLNSAYDPTLEASVWVQGKDGLDKKSIYLFGLGNGAFAKEVVANKAPSSRVMIYEPSLTVFLHALENVDLTFCFQTPGVRLIVEGINDDLFSGVMEEMVDHENVQDFMMFFAPKTETLFPDSRNYFMQQYACYGPGMMNSNKEIERYTLPISPYNQLANLKYLEDNTIVPYFAEVFPKDVPVVLAGAGPSLRDEVETLKKVRDRVFLFAADSALSYLLSEGVVPDAFICIESGKPMSFFKDERCLQIPMFCKVDTTHFLLEVHKAPKVFGCDMEFPQQFYQEYGIPTSKYRYGSNGMTSFFSICDEIGVETVIFVGQDMCYGNEQDSHVGGRREIYVDNERFLCENNSGETVQSRQDWYKLVQWYENALMDTNIKNVYNVSARGVKIGGTTFTSLEKAVQMHGKEHEAFSDILIRAKKTLVGVKDGALSEFYKKCVDAAADLQRVIEKNPRDEQRKQSLLYPLLKKYEIADMKDDFAASQRDGMTTIIKYLEDNA